MRATPAPLPPRSTAFYVWLIILASGSALGLILLAAFSVVEVAITSTDPANINVFYVELLLASLSFYIAPISVATFVLGIMLLPRARVNRDRIFGIFSTVIGGLGALSPLILFVWAFIASRL